MNNNKTGITENKIKNASNSEKSNSNTSEEERLVFEENSGILYSVDDVLDVGAKHHGINANADDIKSNSNKSSKSNINKGCKLT